MSASKLEKKIWNLEIRLREEFQQELEAVFAKIDDLERRLESPQPLGVSPGPAATVPGVPDAAMSPSWANPAAAGAPAPAPPSKRRSRFSVHAVVPVEGEGARADVDDGRPERWIPLEPVAFLESTWNLVLVLGYTESGWLDVLIAGLMLVISAGLQITFSMILLTEDFLGQPFTSQIAAATAWRQKVAHDYKHMDLAQTSLVSRVCNQADGLIISNDQASLIGQINAYMGFDTGDFEPTRLRLGVLLCMLCILLWCLYLCNEFRMICISLEAMLQVPRGRRTKVEHGRFITISYQRFAMYCFMRLTRATIVGLLLYAGIVWLANTTSITDLMLNAVALGAILEVDEMFFAALMPKKIQIKIQDLEAIKITYSQRRSQVESVLLVIFMTGLMIWPWQALVEPLGEAMKLVKTEYCGYNQDFVVGLNENLGVPVGLHTYSFEEASKNVSLIENSVSQYLMQADTSTSDHIRFAFSARDFETKRTETVLATATSFLMCGNLDKWYIDGAENPLKETYAPFWWSLAAGFGLPDSSSCANMSSYCESDEGQLLRLLCPETCSCDKPLTSPWYKVANQGCPLKCEPPREEAVKALPCQDASDAIDWVGFWEDYPGIMASYLTLEDASSDPNVTKIVNMMVQNNSCALLSELGFEPLTSGDWCTGKDLLWAPLAHICPVACGCAEETAMWEKPSYCPTACTCQDASKLDGNFLGPEHEDDNITTCAQAAQLGLCADPNVWPKLQRTPSVQRPSEF
ncbi:unnamed protein product [Durusdinium trenchii]|uniref:Uncharacterized protein n=2 Tax=Durusdinium trenchii TaxID=1381693 RepID=A0ABP0REU8_9DINO